MSNIHLAKRIHEILPKDSVGRYDLFPVFKDADLFSEIVQYLAVPYVGKVDYVAAPEAIGWIIGSAMARELNVGFIPLRKNDKLPYPNETLISQSYVDYSKTGKALEIKKNAISVNSKIIIVDEWVETGESMQCCINLLEKIGCIVVGLATIGVDYRESTKVWIDTGFIRFIGKDM